MKKIICAFLSLVFLCSCSLNKDIRVVNKDLSFKAHIFYCSEKYVCSVTVSNALETTVKIEEGSLAGFTAVYNNGDVKLSYEGIVSGREYPYSAGLMFAPLAEAFAYLEANEYTVNEQDNNYFVTAATGEGELVLYVSPAGLPISAKLSGGEFSAEFYNVTAQKIP